MSRRAVLLALLASGCVDLSPYAPREHILYAEPVNVAPIDLDAYPALATTSAFLELVDVDGDGRDDLVYLDGSRRLVVQRAGETPGRDYAPPDFSTATPSSTDTLAFDELDGRPGQEIIVAGYDAFRYEAATHRLQPLSPFIPQQTVSYRAASGDLDDDGDRDLWWLVSPGSSIWWIDSASWDGAHYDLSTERITIQGRSMSVPRLATVDLDGDDRQELLAFPTYPDPAVNVASIQVQRGGPGLRGDPGTLVSCGAIINYTFADLDGDGVLDLVAINPPADPLPVKHLVVCRGEGGLRYGAPQVIAEVGNLASFVAAADLDRDAQPDLVTWDGYNALTFHSIDGARFERVDNFPLAGAGAATRVPSMQLVDLDQDGLTDQVFWVPQGLLLRRNISK